MKNLFIGAAAVAMLASCNSKPTNVYTVSGDVEGLDGQTIYMRYTIGDSVVLDSAVVENGKFVMEGTVDYPVYSVIFSGNASDRANRQFARFYIEPAEIAVSGLVAGDFTNAVVTGSKTNDEQVAFEGQIKPLYDQFGEIRQQMQQNADNKEVVDSLNALSEELRAKTTEIQKNFIAENPGSYVTPTVIKMIMSGMTFDELNEAYNSLTPEVQATAGEIKEELDALVAVQPGQPAPELEGVNHLGNPEKLSDLKGNVVLVDFWATWCGPCRASLPHIYELYKKYHDKGFEVFCVGDNDSNPDQWKEYIETSKDGMAEYHQILRGLKTNKDAEGNFVGFDTTNDQSKKYAVHFLPTKYLIAADGTIIGKFEDTDALDAKLAEIFE